MKPMLRALSRRGGLLFLCISVVVFLISCSANSNSDNNKSNNGSQKANNHLPIVSAHSSNNGAHFVSPLQLQGQASDSDGQIIATSWSQVSGPAATIVAPDSLNTDVQLGFFSQASATFVFRLTASDNLGGSSYSDVMIDVPRAGIDAGPDLAANSGDTVTLHVDAYYPPGQQTIAWTQTAGPAINLGTANAADLQFTAPVVVTPTTLSFTVTVDTVVDSGTDSVSDVVDVTVKPSAQPPANQPPTAAAGDDQNVYPGDTVTLAGSGTDSDGSIAGYSWQHTPGQASEPAVVIANAQAQSASFTAPDVSVATPLTFTLTVTDNGGATATDTVVITVQPFATLSGAVSTAVSNMPDSDVNDPSLTPVANNPLPHYQHIPNSATVGGYVHKPGVGPSGADSTDAEDIYHVALAPGQVINLYLGQSYFDPTTDTNNLGQAYIEMRLENDYTVPNTTLVSYGYIQGSSGVLSLTVPSANAPADGNYLITIQADAASAYSYVLTVGSSTAAAAQTQGWSTQQEFVPNELIVEFTDPLAFTAQSVPSLAQRAASLGLQPLAGAPGRSMLMSLGDASNKAKAFSILGVANQPIASGDPIQEKIDTIHAAAAILKRADVKSVRLNYIYHPAAVPNDPYYSRQWHYPLINLPQAWDITTGSSNVTVAVIDTGILSKHPDIDPNRLVDGYDFISDATNAGDGDGIDSNPEDVGDGGGVSASSFHGTHVAGTIAANSNNNLGVAGIAWQVNIMPLRTLGINGGSEYDIEQAVLYAAQLPNDSGTVPSRKADIINMSLGGPIRSTTPPAAFTQARQAGVIIIAAAGNSGSSQLSGPAAYNGVVSVSAITMNKTLASYSNYGSTIDVAAPGGDYSDTNGDGLPDAVWSTRGDDSRGAVRYIYDYAAGTSMATPHVAGVAALMKSVYPGLTPDKFDSMLANGELTQDLGAVGRDNSYGYGMIDAQKAVAAALIAAGGVPVPPAPPVLAVTPTSLSFGNQLTSMDIGVSNGGGGTLAITDITNDSGGWLTISAANTDSQGLGHYTASVNRVSLAQGLYSATINVVSNAGTVSVPVSMQVFAAAMSGNAGPQVLELFDINAQRVVQSLRVQPNSGVYNFTFDKVRHGTYTLRSSSDLDNDGTLCELGESCGAYPTLDNTVSSNINVDGSNLNINSLNFETGFATNLPVP